MATTQSRLVGTPASSHTHSEPEIPRLRNLLAEAPAAIGYLSGPDLRWGYVNDFLVHATGRMSADDLLGLTIRDSMPELEGTEILALLESAYRSGLPYRGSEYKIKLNRADTGRIEDRFFDFDVQPVIARSRQVLGVFVYAIDITDQVASRLKAEASEERLRLAQEAAQIGTWEWNPVANTRTLSAQLHRMFGTSPTMTDEELQKIWASRVFPPDWPKVRNELLRTERTGVQEFEYRYDHPQTGLHWFLSKGERLRGTSRYFGVLIDVTERKRWEELQRQKEHELEESRGRLEAAFFASERLAAIVESSDDAIIAKGLDGIVTSWNPGAERMFEYTGEEMIGQSIRKIIPSEVWEEEDRLMSSVARGERTEHFETLRKRKNGDVIEVSLTLSPVRVHDGRIIGVSSISRDITQNRKVERALHVSERLASVGRLAATIAHEINNPLEAVTNLVFLAQHSAGEEDKQIFLEQAQHELARVAMLTKQTLGFYRENKGASSVSLGELVIPLVAVFSARARNKAIRIETDIRQSPTIHAIAGEIRQLFANLLNNSIDAVNDGGRILIRVSAAKERSDARREGVRLTVADTGAGIPKETREKLYEPFFTTKKDVGTGLGLWVTNSILQRHKGTIRVRSSVAPGRSWTVFSVFLPIDGAVQGAGA